jgi:hypothetical protein
MAVAALVAEMGSAILTQRQMQTAADTAAIEGLRLRDELPPAWRDDPQTRASMEDACGSHPDGDCARRWAARQGLFDLFDDNLNPGDGDPSAAAQNAGMPSNFGAGPIVNIEPGSAGSGAGTAIGAGGLFVANGATVYKPTDPRWPFALNLGNDPAGDMVSGLYHDDPSAYAPGNGPVENEQSMRTDFQARPGPAASAFLVRMKRSSTPQEPGVASSGPPLAWVFARGSLIASRGTGAQTGWAKNEGITVRATGIADARPALVVGPSFPSQAIAGVAPFGLSLAYWMSLAEGTPDPNSPTIEASGLIRSGGQVQAGQVFGRTVLAARLAENDQTVSVAATVGFPTSRSFTIRIDNELLRVEPGASARSWTVERGVDGTTPERHRNSAPLVLYDTAAVAQPFVASLPDGLEFPIPLTDRYVPIYNQVTDPASGRSVNRIVGFGQAVMRLVSRSRQPSGYPIQVSITKKPSTVASQNAGMRFVPPADEISAGELDLILGPAGSYTRLKSFAPLLAPALVRSQ